MKVYRRELGGAQDQRHTFHSTVSVVLKTSSKNSHVRLARIAAVQK